GTAASAPPQSAVRRCRVRPFAQPLEFGPRSLSGAAAPVTFGSENRAVRCHARAPERHTPQLLKPIFCARGSRDRFPASHPAENRPPHPRVIVGATHFRLWLNGFNELA